MKQPIFIVNLFLTAGLIGLIGLYLVQINSFTEENFGIEGLESKIHKTQAENQKLEISIADLSSLSRIQSLAARNNMVAISNVFYLDIPSIEVARAK